MEMAAQPTKKSMSQDTQEPLNVHQQFPSSFDIYGRSISNEFRNAYYGDDLDELDGVMDNVTIAGDILYPINDTTLVYSGTDGRWTAWVTPTKPGGTITIDNRLAWGSTMEQHHRP